MYMTRQLSFAGVTFDVKELPLSKDFTEMYDASVRLVSADDDWRVFCYPKVRSYLWYPWSCNV